MSEQANIAKPINGQKYMIAIVQEDKDFNDYLSFLTRTLVNADVVSYHTQFEFEQSRENYDLAISDIPSEVGYIQLKIKKQMENRQQTQFLLLTGNAGSDQTMLNSKQARFLEKPFMKQDYISSLSKYFRNEHRQTAKYIPVKINMLMRMKEIHVPLFLRIGQDKYIKVAHKDSLFDKVAFDRYSAKGVDEFYIQENSAQEFIQSYSKNILAEDAWSRANSLAKNVVVNTEVLRTFSQSVGWSEDLIELAQINTAKALGLAKFSKSFQNVVRSFQKIEKFGYSERATMMVLVTTALAKSLKKGSEEDLRRFTVASLFHDCALSDLLYDKQDRLVDQMKTSASRLNSESQNFLMHPLAASDLVSMWNFAPEGAEKLILNHHELPDGTGFPLKKAANIIDMDCAIFITAHDVVSYFVQQMGNFKATDFLKSRKTMLKHKNFDLIYVELEKLFSNYNA